MKMSGPGGWRFRISFAVMAGLVVVVLFAGNVAMAAVPGTILWVKRYGGPTRDDPQAMVVSPDGSRVFVTGNGGYPSDFMTVAYSLPDGTLLWARRYNGPTSGWDAATAIAVSSDGSRVYVTGRSPSANSGSDYLTVCYDGASGARLWVRRFSGPGAGEDYANSIAVTPDGSKVFVTGSSVGRSTWEDYATVAYNAKTGARLWIQKYNGAGNIVIPVDDSANSIAVSPDGRTAFVTGRASGYKDYTTIAYDTQTGARRWLRRYFGPAPLGDASANEAKDVAVSPDGTSVYVAGESDRRSGAEYATIAYNARTGDTRWVTRSGAIVGAGDIVSGMAASGSTVFVTGAALGAADYLTVAYNASTGATRWLRTYNGKSGVYGEADGIALAPGGSRVYVTGETYGVDSGPDCLTIAYGATTGLTEWMRRYSGPANGFDLGTAVASTPDGSQVLVEDNEGVYTTLAYSAK
jgi:DNA-binding beta-propeller fold protein YncE